MDNYTVKDTGITLKVRKVSPLLLLKLRDRYPVPQPPTQLVDYGDGEKRLEPNPSHPDFAAAQIAYDQMMEQKARELLIRRGVSVIWTAEARADLDELKSWWKENYDEELEGDDDYLYVSYIALGSDSDLEDLVNALVRRTRPTEEATKESLARFPN